MNQLESTVEELLVEWELRRHSEQPVTAEDLCQDHSELLTVLKHRIALLQATDWMFSPATQTQQGQSPLTGQQLGEYEILERLGQGGMGTVYRARHRRLDKLVALKVLLQVRQWDQNAVARFEREMRAAGKLEHPHLVAAFDAGEADGTHYLAMQLIDGGDVSQLVTSSRPLPVAEACEIVRQAALGLQYAHEHGLVHRDIKPSNLMLGRDGIVRVSDLGLAQLDELPESEQQITTSGQVIGTLDYMPPEQLEDTTHVDHLSDIYSLGATLFKLLSGTSPLEHIQGGAMRKMKGLSNGDLGKLDTSRYPPQLVTLIQQMLAVQPSDRPQSAKVVAAQLAVFAAGADLKHSFESPALKSSSHDSFADTFRATSCSTANDSQSHATAVSTPLVSAIPPSVSHAGHPPAADERSLGWSTLLAGLFVVATFLTLAVAVLIQTDKGTLIVNGEGVNVEQLKEAGVRLVHKQSQQTYDLMIGAERLKSGEYLIEVTQQPSGLEFSATEFTIARGTPQEIRVSFKPAITKDITTERWEFVQRLREDGFFQIQVRFPNGKQRGIQAASELPLIHAARCYGPAATEDNIVRLLSFTSLQELEFAGSPRTDLTFAAIGQQTNLRKLSFNICSSLTNEHLAGFRDLKHVTSLMLWGTSITDDGLVHLQNFPELETLQLGECREITGAGLLSLKPLTKLNWLSLHSTSLTDDALKHLHELPQLAFLALGGSTQLTNAGLKELSGLSNIQEILFDKSVLSDEGLAHLAVLPNLKRLRTRQSKVTPDGLAALLRANPNCELDADPQ